MDNNFSGKYRMLHKEYESLEKLYRFEFISKIIFVILFIAAGIIALLLFAHNQILIKENKKLLQENLEFTESIAIYTDAALYFADISIAMEENNIRLKEMYSESQDELDWYRNREELYDAYEWAMYDNGKKNDLTYDQILSLQEYCDQKGYKSDMVDLVLSFMMTESRGKELAQNQSGASGYCQLLDSTARFVYTKIQGNVSYTHDVSLDGDANLRMCADYIDYLYEYYHHDMGKVIDSYRGLHSEAYIAKLNSYLSNNDKSIYTLDIK